jgi:beta-N-acetylhexosaminidase
MTGPVCVDLPGTTLTEDDRARLRHPRVGMVLLFSRNYESPAQLRALCDEIHALRQPPLLIAVDHEGGRVQRFRSGFTRLPPMAVLGRLWDRDVLGACRAAQALGYVLAAELRAQGVDLSFTPVVDLDWGHSAVIGDRAFHADPRVVAMLAANLNHGLALAGMSHCAKHFPGHGWAVADSHLALPVDERPLEQILRDDALPYAALGVGLDSVMLAHVVYAQVDEHPAGFSRRWIRDILRGRLGFDGVVFCDDLSMQGARHAGDLPASARAAQAAGCDVLLVCNDPAGADRVLAGLDGQPEAGYEARIGRLRPRVLAGAAPASAGDTRYARALAEVQALSA